MVKLIVRTLSGMNKRYTMVCAAAFAALVAVFPAAALATESATEEKLKAVTTQVSSEGVSIILAVLTGLVALIAAIIIIPKAIGFIRRFV